MNLVHKHSVLAILVLLFSISLLAKDSKNPFVLVSGEKLQKARELYASGEYKKNPALKKLLKDCEKTLNAEFVTVVDKKEAGPSGNKHDYFSFADYYWPNPDTPDKFPYIKKDGEVNPDIYDAGDKTVLPKMLKATFNLGIGYYITGKREYAEKCMQWLQAWFLDTTTMMNPNLEYSQIIRGSKKNNYSGLIDGCELPKVMDAITMVSESELMTPQMKADLKKWFEAYLDWIVNSEMGTKESKSENNHGSWYDQDVAALALFVGRNNLVKQVCENVKTKRISVQIEPDGAQPKELARTRSLHYSSYNLKALTKLANIAAKVNIDLWNYTSPKGGSIRKALNYLLPYISGEQKWENKQITDYKIKPFYEIFVMASDVYHDDSYVNAAAKNAGVEQEGMYEALIY
jgi:hypothetical protein